MSRLSLKQQLAALEGDNEIPDPENAYSSLDGMDRSGEAGGSREHYLEVGPSRLRTQIHANGGGTLASSKYAGATTGRQKIFDDDDEDDEAEEDDADLSEDEEDNEEAEDGVNSDEDEEIDDEDDEEEDEQDPEEESDEEDEDAEPEDPEAGPSRANGGDRTNSTSAARALDPVSALKEARAKDIERGRGIRRQKAIFDAMVALRITYQKALTASQSLPIPLPSDPTSELDKRKEYALNTLAELNETLFELRSSLALPETEVSDLGKRKREVDEQYFLESAKDSMKLVQAQHEPMVSILNKWSSKILAASLPVNSKAAGSSKFLNGTKGQPGIVEVIESSLAKSSESEKTFMENEESGYRSLLREVIEARSGGVGADLTHLRREKKKKREADRGGSKGRRLRYTVHEKAQNFVVPIPLRDGWREEQVDELFSSLLGGAGVKGAGSEMGVNGLAVMNGHTEGEGLADLGGLRVF